MESGNLVEKIQLRAYEIWESKGRPTGQDLENWLQAESECRGDSMNGKARTVSKPRAKKIPAPVIASASSIAVPIGDAESFVALTG